MSYTRRLEALAIQCDNLKCIINALLFYGCFESTNVHCIFTFVNTKQGEPKLITEVRPNF